MYIFCTITQSIVGVVLDPKAQKWKQEMKTIWRLKQEEALHTL